MFASVLILAVDFTGRRRRGPLGKVVEPSEGLKGPFLVIVVVRDLGGNTVVLPGRSKGVVIPLVEPVLVNGLCDHTGRSLDRAGGDIKGLVVGRAFVDRFAEWVVETAGQTDIVLLRPGRGEAAHADGERATGEIEPRGPERRPEGLLLVVSIALGFRSRVDGPEGITVDGLAFEIGFVRGKGVAGDPGNGGSREREPSDLRDI